MILLQTPLEQSIINDFLFKQAPVIAVLGLGLFFMYRYFTGLLNKKEEALMEKDKLYLDTIKEDKNLIIELHTKTLASIDSNTKVQERMIDMIDELKDEVVRLREKIDLIP
jgi:hypothetical protein